MHPYPPGRFPQQGYYAPGPAYAGLTGRQRRSAAWAGALGLNLMGTGGTVLSGTVLVGVLAVAFAGVSTSAGRGSGLQGFGEFLDESGAPIWFLIAAAAGVVVLLIGMFVSVAILRTGGVRRPFAVTWSAFAITLPLLAVIGFIGGVIAQIVTTATLFTTATSSTGGAGPDGSPATTALVVAIVAYLVSVGVVGVIGWLAWWWMAHAFRERTPVAS